MIKPSTYICQAAEILSQKLAQKYSIADDSLPQWLQLELFKVVTDYSQFLLSNRDNLEISEFEMLLIKHKNKQAFITAFCERTAQDSKIAEKLYTKLRQKMS